MAGSSRTGISLFALLAMLVGGSALAQDAEPLNAIDWLSRSVEAPVVLAPSGTAPSLNGAATPQVSVTPLDRPTPDGIGLLPLSVTGLPVNLWAASQVSDVVALVQAERLETLPAIYELLITLLLAEGAAPIGSGPEGEFLLARADKLLDIGAIEQAQALIEAGDPSLPDAFRRWFDVALLTGTEAEACRVMEERPDVAPTYPARIFCIARAGDWNAAALILNTGRALGDIDPEMDALLSRFLDPDLYEGEPNLPQPARVSPLIFRMHEAIGEPIPTSSLPRAFAHADLRDTAGWRNQMEAAERLVRDGALTHTVLWSLYNAKTPAASGGIWSRAEAMQDFGRALGTGKSALIEGTLETAWAAAQQAGVEVAFADEFGARLAEVELSGPARDIALKVRLLSRDYEGAAIAHADALDPLLVGIARGTVTAQENLTIAEQAVVNGFNSDTVPIGFEQLLADGKIGETLLRAIALFSEGLSGDPSTIGEALVVFRRLGLEDFARRATLQYLILDHPS